MKAIDKEKLKQLTIRAAAEQFHWNTLAQRSMVIVWKATQPIVERESVSWTARKKAEFKEDMEHAARLTLANVLSALAQYQSSDNWRRHREWRGVKERLTAIGFTRLDCIALPAGTVTIATLKQLPHDLLLRLDASFLRSISEIALRSMITDYDSKTHQEILHPRKTIGDLLQLRPGMIHGRGRAKTIQIFEQLGFSSKDGPLLARVTDPRYQLSQNLMQEYKLTRQQAKLFARIAANKNWI